MTAGGYLIRSGDGPVKIGRSTNIEGRLGLLQTGSPVALTIIHMIETPYGAEAEALLHTQYAERRGRGEWFDLTEDDLLAILDFAMPAPPVPRAPRPRPPVPAPPPITPRTRSIPVPSRAKTSQADLERFAGAVETLLGGADSVE